MSNIGKRVVCPICGAHNQGRGKCSVCAASLTCAEPLKKKEGVVSLFIRISAFPVYHV